MNFRLLQTRALTRRHFFKNCQVGVGAIALSALAEGLSRLQNGVTVLGVRIDIPDGSQQVGFALSMLAVLLLRPDGLTGGRELTLRPRRPGAVD